MFHLIVEQGKEVGREVSVPAAGMKFGRSPANDLVLDDNEVMPFHGRFFFKSDGSLWVTDFDAGKKTTVGGVPIDEHPLKAGDLVEVGLTAFRVIHTQSNPEEAAGGASGEIDLGFHRSRRLVHAKTDAPTNTLIERILQVGVILLVLLVLVIVVPKLIRLMNGKNRKLEVKPSLALAYERVIADRDNIFRYVLDLDATGRCQVKIDDLKNNRHILKEKTLPDHLLMQLSRSIEETGFFRIGSDFAGPVENQYKLFDIAVQRNRSFHRIKVLNWDPPLEIKRTVAMIEDFAISEMDIPFTLFTDNAELVQRAEHAYSLARERYAERDVSYGNLAAAIRHYREVQLYLDTIEPKPKLFAEAEKNAVIAETERDKRYADYLFRAERARAMGNWSEAASQLRICIELVPNRDDERYEKISTMLLNVEQRLK